MKSLYIYTIPSYIYTNNEYIDMTIIFDDYNTPTSIVARTK